MDAKKPSKDLDVFRMWFFPNFDPIMLAKASPMPMHKTPLNNINGFSFDKSEEIQSGKDTPANK